ncbi:NAD(P)-dependent oxidoreductase [Dysgonomonas massiliensis]|uniref:NAD(P)-dependent oxidoreductase n=1 Tax=Dysgonomonas massiliensis TaxID=2040292 RepID=UPI001C87D1F7|nr:NAD(P)-dependent oxidoreductase [Dysgonomonas massiliensis]
MKIMNTKSISWIGLGHMGVPMVLNLLKAGYALSVYNRSVEKLVPVVEKGATQCTSVAEAAKSDIIFLMLSDDKAVSAIADQLLAAGLKGKLVINMSTISVDMTTEVASKVRAQGGHYIEAPVSGSVKPATDGTLIVLAGGTKADFEEALPYFERMAKLSLHLGEVGQGAKAKLAINYYMSVVIDGLAETVLFAEKNGIDRETMLQIVNESACGSPMSNMKTQSIIQNQYPAAFPLRHMDKDINLAIEQGLDTPTAKSVANAYKRAMDRDLADEDLMAVIKVLKETYFND